ISFRSAIFQSSFLSVAVIRRTLGAPAALSRSRSNDSARAEFVRQRSLFFSMNPLGSSTFYSIPSNASGTQSPGGPFLLLG
ncbi:hypothetical protein MK280_06970, partial [Myxococcota bacterium]|nr:hypothetical protein [Myxococcota bacterium]